MSATILLKRSNTAGNNAYTGPLGEVTIDTEAKKLRVHDGVTLGGHIVANMSDLTDLVANISGLSIENISGLEAALTTINTNISNIQSTYIKKDGTVAFTGNVNMGSKKITSLAPPTANTDAANKAYVDNTVNALGAVFRYVGTVEGGTSGAPFSLTSLTDKNPGAYYRVTKAGYLTHDSVVTQVNIGDAIVFNSTGYEKLDNTDPDVKGTSGFVAVSGTTETGFTVDLDAAIKADIATLKTSAPTSISGTLPIAVNNTNPKSPVISINAATTSAAGSMSSADKAKLDGIAAGAQVNTVTKVAGRVGDVVLARADVGLNLVNNYGTANNSEHIAAASSTLYATPAGVKAFVEGGNYTVDGGTF